MRERELAVDVLGRINPACLLHDEAPDRAVETRPDDRDVRMPPFVITSLLPLRM